MPVFPIQSTTGDPVFRSQNNSLAAIRRFTRISADSSQKLNNQERIVSPGDDALSFNVSQRARTEITSLKVVGETGQLNVTGLGLAIEGLGTVKAQLDKIKKALIQSQTADPADRAGIQAEIDLALSQIDATAKNTKLGNRTLLDGGSTLAAFSDIATATGVKTNFAAQRGTSVNQAAGINAVRVNKIGFGGPVRTLADGRRVLSLRVSLATTNHARKACLTYAAGAAATDFAEFRITGKLGSATVRMTSTGALLTQAAVTAKAVSFNELAAQTGVVFVSKTGAAAFSLTTVGYGDDEFVKVELTAKNTGGTTMGFGGLTAADPVGTVVTAFGTAATVRVNGSDVKLSGEFGTTARYQQGGYDIEVDLASNNLLVTDNNAAFARTINIDLTGGVVGLLGASGKGGEIVHYGVGNFTTTNLGRSAGGGFNTLTVVSSGARLAGTLGNKLLGAAAIAELGTGGSLALTLGKVPDAISTVDNAISQVIKEQTRLGTLQGNFIDAINRAQTQVGNLSAADADIIGVDAATEITNLIQAQLGVSTASSVLSQANAIQANIFSLLRG